MARQEDPPFQRGETYFTLKGETPNLVDALNWLGKTWIFEDKDLTAAFGSSGSAKPSRSNRGVKCMLVRNGSGGTLAPKLMAKMDISTPDMLGQVSGLATALGDFGYPIDEFLPAAVADDDIFWIVVEGPAKITTAAAGDTNISAGDFLTYATGGKVVGIDATVTGADLFNAILNCPGHATAAVNAINTEFMMNVLPRGIF